MGLVAFASSVPAGMSPFAFHFYSVPLITFVCGFLFRLLTFAHLFFLLPPMLLRSIPLTDTEVLVIDDPVVGLTCAVVVARFLVSCGLFTPNALGALTTFYSHWHIGARSVQQVTLPGQHEAL
jgi:hypothetical protein